MQKNNASAHHCPDFQCVLKGLFHFYLKIDLKKIFLWFFFPVKAEIPYFSDLTLGGPRGDLGKRYFTLKLLIFWKFSLWHLSQISKYSLPKSPRGPPNVRPEKYGISGFTETKMWKSLFMMLYTKMKMHQRKTLKMSTISGRDTRLSPLIAYDRQEMYLLFSKSFYCERSIKQKFIVYQ